MSQPWPVRQVLDGGKRVFAKTTFVLESPTSLGPQSCGDTRGKRTRLTHSSSPVSQQSACEPEGCLCSPLAARIRRYLGDL